MSALSGEFTLRFPEGFVWGAATSNYQIEGATTAEGRGRSIWDTFCDRAGAIEDGSDARVACDHYHRWPEDLDLVAKLGLRAYRFSIGWPRVLPRGRGAPNEPGLEFYDRLVDGLLERGIEPWATLYHWDLPQTLEDAGGWPDRAIVDAFVEFTDVVTRRLGDRVQNWITLNEPWIIANLGYDSGVHAPGRKDLADALASAHHVLLAHGRAVPVIRANVPDARVGITRNLVPGHPASESPEDRAAATIFDGFFNRWYLDPLYRAAYPEDTVEHYRGRLRAAYPELDAPRQRDPLAAVHDGDLAEIAVPTDFLGVNYYSRVVAREELGEDGTPGMAGVEQPGTPTDMGWEVYPAALEELLLRLHEDYDVGSLVITENGAAYAQGPDAAGVIDDAQRVVYLDGHLRACARAIAQGAPLDGYFVWSLLDNFEWAHGYAMRFGITWVDYETQARTLKRSARWYAEVVQRGGLEDEGVGR